MADKGMRTDLGRVRGLGTAKEGVHHWWMQRLTAIALIPLTLWFIISIATLNNASYTETVNWLSIPLVSIFMILLVSATLYHALLGVQVVVEDYTGTWCGYCPPVAHAIYELKEVYDNIISVGIHNNDELTIDQESDLRSELGISGFPSARLNRTISWLDPYHISDVNSLLSEENDVAISINSNSQFNFLFPLTK